MSKLPGFHIIDKYVLKELFNPFVFGTMGFVIIGITDILFSLVELFINKGVPFLVVGKLLLYKVPDILVLFLPMAALFATVLSWLRFTRDSETVVLRTSGFSLGRIIFPLLIFGVLVSLLALFINEEIVPRANQTSEKLLRTVIQKNYVPDVVENTFLKVDGQQHFFIKKYDAQQQKMFGVAIYELTGRFPRTILAEEASLIKGKWTLKNGSIFRYSQDQQLQHHNVFEKMVINLDLNEQFTLNKKSEREMDSFDLKQKIKQDKKNSIDTKKLEVALHLKRAIPFSSLIFVLLGTAIIIIFVRNKNDLWGMIFSILLSLSSVGFYFFVMATFRALGFSGAVTPFMGGWGPNIIFGMVSVVLLIREHYVK